MKRFVLPALVSISMVLAHETSEAERNRETAFQALKHTVWDFFEENGVVIFGTLLVVFLFCFFWWLLKHKD